MTAPDDIRDIEPSQPSKEPSPKPRRVVGPESEARGGSQAPEETLDTMTPDEMEEQPSGREPAKKPQG